MKPYYEHAGITIYQGDCRLVVNGGSVGDVVLTDPPYGHGKRWTGGGYFQRPLYAGVREWDAEAFDSGELLRLIGGKPSVVWGGNYFSLPPSRCWLSWEKTSRMPTMADFELAWTSLDRPAKAFVEDRNPDGDREHPTQKPLSLMSWCLGFLPEGVVFDPFMGSGTTLVAAKNLGRKAVGIEIEERYCEIAAKRLAQEVLL